MTKRIEHLNYLERYCNEGTRTYSRYAAYSEAREEYQPGARRTSFELPCFSLPRGKLNIYTANPAPELAEKYLADRHALFCVHPQVLAEQRTDPYVAALLESGQPHDPIAVSPSASTRTLLVPDTTAEHALKVHFPFRVSRYDRRMRDEVIEQAINVSRELEAGIDRLDADFAFLREVIGVTHKNLAAASPRGENWGYLVRDMRPFPELDAECLLVPGFALYGRDLFARTEAPLLFELISAADPRGDVLEHIMLPIIRHWVACFVNFGYLLEPHAQNTLFEIDQQQADPQDRPPRSERRHRHAPAPRTGPVRWRHQQLQPDGVRTFSQYRL